MFTSIRELHKLFSDHPVVSTDSRKIMPGTIFFALKGDNFNGNSFAARAIGDGAAYAVVDDPAIATNEKFLLVPDVLTALQDLARFHRQQFSIPVIAITGSNGKTTTKELVTAVLSSSLTVLATKGNLNNHIGVPLTLLGMTSETQIAIIEMGANHPGEIDTLCRIALPDHGIITNIGRAHLEGFGGFEGVVRTKTELYRFLSERTGLVFVNGLDDLLLELSTKIRRCIYGSEGSSAPLISLTSEPLLEVRTSLSPDELTCLRSNLYGNYNAGNILAAVCIGRHFGISPENIIAAIEGYQPSNNRSQIMRTSRNLLVLDAYNANPSSMKAALDAFAMSGHANKSVILGDMLELGAYSDDEHLTILKMLESIVLKQIMLVGPRFTRLNTRREFICFNDVELAKLWLEHHRPENETILLKGSRGIKLETLTETL